MASKQNKSQSATVTKEDTKPFGIKKKLFRRHKKSRPKAAIL